MFTRKVNSEDPLLNEEIERVLTDISKVSIQSDDYPKLVESLSKLYSLKPEQPKPISNDTLAMIAGNLAGIVLIVGYERANIVTSKALGFVLKLR